MKLNFRPHITREMAVRMVADALMVNAALLIALTMRYFWQIWFETMEISPQVALRNYALDYFRYSWILMGFSVIFFYASGFYTHGRAYRGRYKALVVFQAVSLSFLAFGFLTLLLFDTSTFPRVALLVAWLLTLVFVSSARLWSKLFRTFYRAEQQLWPNRSTDGEIKNVLVIGGAGFIGSALLVKLLEKGYKVRVLDLFLYGYETVEAVQNHPNLELMEGDFHSMNSIVHAMRGMDAVVHLGAIVGDPACELDRGMTVELNSLSVHMIAEVAKIMKVERFIFASTCSVYGASDEILNELSVLKPVSLYAESKILTEQILMSLASKTFAPVILRFGTIYGFSGRTRFDLVINLLTAKAVFDGEITVYGGDQWRPFVHVEDAALAITQVLEVPRYLVHNQIFNVGSNQQNYTIQQAAEIIHGLVPSAELKNMGSETDKRNYRVDFSKIRNVVGFVPEWTVEDGVKQVIAKIQSGKILDYRDPKYSNERFLRKEGLVRLKTNSDASIYDLLNATISPAPWDGVERRRTKSRKTDKVEELEAQWVDQSQARRKTPKIRSKGLEASK